VYRHGFKGSSLPDNLLAQGISDVKPKLNWGVYP
jgi:hypothetical protein